MQDDDDDDNGGDSSEAIRIEMTEVASAERHLREQFGDAGLGVTLPASSRSGRAPQRRRPTSPSGRRGWLIESTAGDAPNGETC